MPGQSRALARGLALSYSLALLGDQMLYVFLPSHPADAGITAASVGIVLSANRIVRLAANSLGGLVSDRVGRRGPYLAGMALAFLSTTGYLVSSSFWPLVASRVVWGFAFALISVGGYAIMLDLSTDADRGRVIGVYQSMLQLGTLVGLVGSGVLTDLLGYRNTLAIYMPLAALGAICAALTLRRSKAADPGARPRAAGERGAGLRGLSMLLKLDPRLLLPAAVSFVSRFTSSGVLMATLGVYVKQLAGNLEGGGLLIPVASLTGVLLAASRLAAMAEAPVVGRLLDRSADRGAVSGAGVALSLAGFAVLAWGPSTLAVIAGVVLVAVGEGVIAPAVTIWAGGDASPALRGVVMGALATAGDLGAALGPLVGYAMAEAVGLRSAYGLCGGLLVSALVMLAMFPAPTRSASRA